jgi:HK97 family phage portal protein
MSLMQFFGLAPSPTDDFWYGPTGTKTVAGVAVDENVAMTYSACWACTRVLATAGAMAPLELLRELEEGGSEPAKDMRRYNFAFDQFNPNMTNFMFRSSRIAQQINWGNSFSEIEFSGAGQIVAFHPIHASRIPQRNVKQEPDGSVYYLVNNNDGTQTRLEAWEMLHVPSPMSSDGIFGIGVVTQARLSIGFGIATETQGAAYMGNSARPTIVIKGGKFKDPAERAEYRRQWEELYGGPQNNARPALLPPEADITALNWSAEDSQFLTTRQHNVEEVARWYGVPPHMIGHLLRSTYNNIEHQSIEFVRWTLRPWLVAEAQELDRKVLVPEERKTLYFHHDLKDLERGDLQTRTNAFKEQFFNGKISLNEWRAEDDEKPIGPAGDIHFVQQAMIPVDMAAKGPQKPEQANPDETAEKPKDDKPEEMAGKSLELLTTINDRLSKLEVDKQQQVAAATLEVVGQVVGIMLEREAKDALDAARKPSQFLAWMDQFYTDHAPRMEKALAKPIRACALAMGRTESADDIVRESVAKHIAAGRESLLQAASVPADQFPKAVESCVTSWNRTEILSYLGGCNGNH